MKQTKLNVFLFNAAGLGLVVFLGGYMVNAALHQETIPRCSARYGDGQQFSLIKSDGELLSPIELQARLPVREWGMLTSARVVSDKNAAYLQVALGPHERAAGDAEPAEAEEGAPRPQDGVGFLWQPQNLKQARSACLSYRVYLSKDFSFDKKGTLPGLYAAADMGRIDSTVIESGFVSRLGWDKGGGMGVNVKTPLTAGMWIPVRASAWPVNRWVSVEQEAVLNTPEKADGVLRIWIDGELKLEHTSLNLGASTVEALSGVVADVGYAEQVTAVARVTMSPFVVQTQ